MTFTQYNVGKLHINNISQQYRDAWSTFILDKSNGFTRPGVESIKDSIRTYCWAIIGSQSQIKSDILGVGSAFDVQKQILVNTENAIQSLVDLPSQITRYQNALQYARSKVDYVFGFGLYMAPSDMELRIGTIEGYNNKIILSTHNQKLWWKATVNLPAKATSYSIDVSGTPAHKSTAHTTPTGQLKPLTPDISVAIQGKNNRDFWHANNDTNSKQVDKIYEKGTEQYHKIKDTYGPTITLYPHQMSLIPKTVAPDTHQLLPNKVQSNTHKN